MNSSLKLFTQSDVLQQIGIDSLQKFLNQLTDSDSRLSSLDSDSPYLCSELARLFTQAQSLSPRVREVLLLLESAASHENYDQVSAIAQQRLPSLCVTEFHPLALALELWLAFPDDLSQFRSSSSSSSFSSSIEMEKHDSQEPVGMRSTHLQSNNSSSSIQYPDSSLPYPASSIQNPASDCSQIENQNSKIENPLNLLRSLLTRYVILPEHAAEALALWIVHTYAFELRDVTTYLGLESPVRRCGKSTLLTVLSRLVNRPLVAANVSPSALYRAIEELRPTLMIDEADTFLKTNDELTGILNAGYYQPTAFVLRVASERSGATHAGQLSVPLTPALPMNPPQPSPRPTGRGGELGDPGFRGSMPELDRENLSPSNGERESSTGGFSEDGAPSPNPIGRGIKGEGSASFAPSDGERVGVRGSRLVRFSCWCPKIIARIGRLPETLADRCIVIRMQRKTPNDQCERLRDFDMVAVRKDLRKECAQFVQDHRDAIISAKPAIPAALNDRAADIWEPLLAIADCAGGDWPALAREAALALSSDPPDTSLAPSDGERVGVRGSENCPDRVGHCPDRVGLLRDIFILFAATGHDRIPTRALVEALNTQFTDRPWMETRKGQRSTEMWLSDQLRPFGINPRTFRNQDSILRGYHRDDFTEAFGRYIPQSEMDTFRALGEKNVAPATPAGPPASGTHRDQR